MKKLFLFFALLCLAQGAFAQEPPLRVALAGVRHGHVEGVFKNMAASNIEIVGVWEADPKVASAFAKRFNISPSIIYSDLGKMLDAVHPEAVAAYSSIYDHLAVVEAAAPRGIPVMVEKPLAVSAEHARKIAELARKHGIIVMTNYQTTWAPSTAWAYDEIAAGKIGPLRKAIIYDGHSGPANGRTPQAFFEFLSDPVQNGGGAVTDFGCYGANLLTWLMKGERPAKVYADIRTHDPVSYPKVDDDATILVSYKDMEGVINASWAWPFDRKDMHLYGRDGYIFADTGNSVRYRYAPDKTETPLKLPALPAPYNNPYRYLAAWIRGKIAPKPYDLSSLENNIMVVEILDAAKQSAKDSRAVALDSENKQAVVE